MKTKFPNWGYVHFSLVKEMEGKYNMQFDFKNLRLSYNNLLEDFNEKNAIEQITHNIIKGIKIKKNSSPIDVLKLIDNTLEFPEWTKQVITIFNLSKFQFDYVQPNIGNIINIEPQDFTPQALYGQDLEKKYYHPEDLLIIMRHAYLCYFVLATCGLEIDSSKFYLHQNYRIRIDGHNDGNYLTVNKNAFIIKGNFENSKQELIKHLYYWSFLDDTSNFNKVNATFCNVGNGKEYYLNQMLSSFNARIYGFSSKEIFILYYWNKYKKTKDISNFLNSTLKTKNFTPRKVSDFIYRLSKKIIKIYKENIILHEIDEETQKSIISANALTYALKLGLLDFDESIIVKIGESALTN